MTETDIRETEVEKRTNIPKTFDNMVEVGIDDPMTLIEKKPSSCPAVQPSGLRRPASQKN